MAFSFLNYTYLAIGVFLLGAYGIFFWGKNGRLKGLRKGVFTGLRIGLLLLLIFSLSGIQGTVVTKREAVLFLVDGSMSSFESRQKYSDFVQAALGEKGNKDQVGLLAFGENALPKVFLSKTPNFSGLSFTGVNEGYTNIEKAIESGVKLLPKGYNGKVVLLTDGEENLGNIERTERLLKEKGIQVLSFKPEKSEQIEAAVDKLDIPKSIEEGRRFGITVQITSTVNQEGTIVLSGPGGKQEKKVKLNKGMNRFVFSDVAKTSGMRIYTAYLSAARDMESKNNQLAAFTEIKNKPALLLVAEKFDEAKDIMGILKANGSVYDLRTPKELPDKMEDLLRYKGVILCNVSAENLPKGFMTNIEPYVRDFGRGLIATGGENSFALGGYYKTPLEATLPVNMEMKGKKQIPDMSMMLIIDKSGSMQEGRGGIMKVDLAKEAAARVLESLRPSDQLGIIAFDENVFWVNKLAKVENPDLFRDNIGNIRAGGGTSILPALGEGIKSLKEANTKIKHIILLTDGQAETTGYDGMLEDAKKSGITISTVAVGQDADRRLLFQIAEKCEGRFYLTDEFSNIPAIFAKETFMAAKEYLNNRDFTPKLSGSHKVLENVAEKGLPILHGYVGSSTKPTAIELFTSDKEDPILAVWNYGSGRAAAWTSDVSGGWNGEWTGWAENRILWTNLISWAAGAATTDEVLTEMDISGGSGVLKLYDKKFGLGNETAGKGFVIKPNGERLLVDLQLTEPGVYEGHFSATEPGVYTGGGAIRREGREVPAVAAGAVNRYSAEFSLLANSGAYDSFMKSIQGTTLTSGDQVFSGKPREVKASLDLSELMLWLVGILFLGDIAVRRLPIPFEAWEKWIRKKIAGRKTKPKRAKSDTPKREPAIPEKNQSTLKEENKKTEKPLEELDMGMLLKKKRDREK